MEMKSFILDIKGIRILLPKHPYYQGKVWQQVGLKPKPDTSL